MSRTRLASAWHTDADLGRPIEVVTDTSKSRRLGFLDYQATDDAIDLYGRACLLVGEEYLSRILDCRMRTGFPQST